MNAKQIDELGAQHAKKLIRWCLAEDEVMEFSALVRQTDMAAHLVRCAVRQLIMEGLVSRVQAGPTTSRAGCSTGSMTERYRWNHEADFGQEYDRPRSPFVSEGLLGSVARYRGFRSGQAALGRLPQPAFHDA